MSAHPPVADLKSPVRWIDDHGAGAVALMPTAGLTLEHFAFGISDTSEIDAALSCLINEDLGDDVASSVIDLALRCTGRAPHEDGRIVPALTYIVREIGSEPYEHFVVVWFDAPQRVRNVCRYECKNGPGEAWLSLRALLRDAVLLDAVACVAAHNHPSGCLRASQADRALHAQLSRLLTEIGVQLLCNAVVTAAGAVDIDTARRWAAAPAGSQREPASCSPVPSSTPRPCRTS